MSGIMRLNESDKSLTKSYGWLIDLKIKLAQKRGLKCQQCGCFLFINKYPNSLSFSDSCQRTVFIDPDMPAKAEMKTFTLHHKNRDHSNNDESNLEILCPTCHAREHNKYNRQLKMRLTK